MLSPLHLKGRAPARRRSAIALAGSGSICFPRATACGFFAGCSGGSWLVALSMVRNARRFGSVVWRLLDCFGILEASQTPGANTKGNPTIMPKQGVQFVGDDRRLGCVDCPGNGGRTHFDVSVTKEPMERPNHASTKNRVRTLGRCNKCESWYAFDYGS